MGCIRRTKRNHKLSEFFSKIRFYRDNANSIEKNPNIGCIVLTNPIFFDESDWISTPEDWARNIERGKTYSTDSALGKEYWNRVESVLQKYLNAENTYANTEEQIIQYGTYLSKYRIGQGAFRVLVTDAYSRNVVQ